jgi:acetate---CoA ligase (ADP-forming)
VMAPCLSLVAEDPSIGTVVMASNMPPGRPFVAQCTDAVISVFRHTEKPVVLLGNMATTMASEALSRVRAEGIPVLMGTDTGLRALTHFTTYLPRRARPLAVPVEADCEKARQWKSKLDKIAGGAVSSSGGFDLLAAFDIQSAPFVRVASESDLKAFVKAQTWSVVLKIDDPAIPHKSEVGGIILNISSEQKAIKGYRRLKDRHPEAPMLAQVQLTGYELILGMTTDEVFGPMVTIGLGGIYAEIFNDSVVLPPPIDRNSARQALNSLRCFPILAGARGKTPANIDALLHAIECFGRLAMSVKGMVSEIEINPVIAGENGAFAVDCLVSMCLEEPNERRI